MTIDERLDLPQGTLDLLILKALSLEAMHGWAISERIHQVSKATLQIPQGSLYPALHRLERRGLIKASWGASDNTRRAKYYALTRTGRAQLDAVTEDWRRLTVAVGLVLDLALEMESQLVIELGLEPAATEESACAQRRASKPGHASS